MNEAQKAIAKAKRTALEDTCLYCGTHFAVTKDKKKYCSQGCWQLAMKLQSGSKNPSWKGGKVFRECLNCGQKISCYPSQNKRFCSLGCFGKYKSPSRQGAKNPNHRGGVEVPCAHCGRKTWVCPSRATIYHVHYCSVECFRKGDFTRDRRRWQKGNRWGAQSRKSGKRSDLGNKFFRSSWEANYARILNWMKDRGQIFDWAFEADTFEFKGIKRGTRFYTPDFRIWTKTGFEYHEIKGYMTQKGRTALERMGRYHPDIRVILIDAPRYKVLARQFKSLVPFWEK